MRILYGESYSGVESLRLVPRGTRFPQFLHNSFHSRSSCSRSTTAAAHSSDTPGFAILVGIIGSATVIGSFVGSIPSIAAVVLNYLKRRDARGTWLDSHYRWQIRTFWFAISWVVLAAILFFTIVGIPVTFAILIAVTLWLVYRIARGWLRLLDRRPMYV